MCSGDGYVPFGPMASNFVILAEIKCVFMSRFGRCIAGFGARLPAMGYNLAAFLTGIPSVSLHAAWFFAVATAIGFILRQTFINATIFRIQCKTAKSQ